MTDSSDAGGSTGHARAAQGPNEVAAARVIRTGPAVGAAFRSGRPAERVRLVVFLTTEKYQNGSPVAKR